MKKLIATFALLCIFGFLMAQQSGTIDKSFANNGQYSLTVDGYRASLNFVKFQAFEDDGNPGTPAWGLLIGGNMYTNFMSGDIFFTEFNDISGQNEWYGSAPTELTDFQDAIYLPGGGILAGGSWSNMMGQKAKIAKFTSPGVVDNTFGTSGSITIDDQAGTDYIHALCLNVGDPDNPYIMAAGSSFDQNNKQRPAWWMLDQNGLLNTGFGSDGKYMPDTNTEQAWFNDILPFGNQVVGFGQVDYLAYMNVMDPNTMVNNSYIFPETKDENHLYEFFSAGQDANNFYPSGYHYDMVTYTSNALVKKVDNVNLTVDSHDALSPDIFAKKVEEEVGGHITGIQGFFPAPPGPENVKNQGPGPMIMVGSLIIGDQPETTFLAAMSADGNLDESFGNRGVTVIDLEGDNWPKDFTLDADGSIYVGINAGNSAYVIKFHPYFDLSGIDQPNQLSEKVEIFPNPADEYLNLTIVLENAQSIRWTVVNNLGQEVLSKTESNLTSGNHQLRIDIKNLTPGVYFFRTNTLKGSLTSRFMVN